MKSRESLDRKKAPTLAAAALAAIALLGACSNNTESTPQAASVSASPNFVPKDASELPSPPAVPQETTSAEESPSNESPAVEQSLDTNYDEAEIIKQINIMRSQAVEESIAALEIAKSPELAAQLGLGEVWWKAQIDIANAYITADTAVRNLPGDPDSHGFNYGSGFLAKAMLPLYASGLKMAQENNIPPVSSDSDQYSVTINGEEVGAGNLGLNEWIMTKPERKSLNNICISDYYKPFDAAVYTKDNPMYSYLDDGAREIVKQQDKTIHEVVDNYVEAIGANC